MNVYKWSLSLLTSKTIQDPRTFIVSLSNYILLLWSSFLLIKGEDRGLCGHCGVYISEHTLGWEWNFTCTYFNFFNDKNMFIKSSNTKMENYIFKIKIYQVSHLNIIISIFKYQVTHILLNCEHMDNNRYFFYQI